MKTRILASNKPFIQLSAVAALATLITLIPSVANADDSPICQENLKNWKAKEAVVLDLQKQFVELGNAFVKDNMPLMQNMVTAVELSIKYDAALKTSMKSIQKLSGEITAAGLKAEDSPDFKKAVKDTTFDLRFRVQRLISNYLKNPEQDDNYGPYSGNTILRYNPGEGFQSPGGAFTSAGHTLAEVNFDYQPNGDLVALFYPQKWAQRAVAGDESVEPAQPLYQAYNFTTRKWASNKDSYGPTVTLEDVKRDEQRDPLYVVCSKKKDSSGEMGAKNSSLTSASEQKTKKIVEETLSQPVANPAQQSKLAQ